MQMQMQHQMQLQQQQQQLLQLQQQQQQQQPELVQVRGLDGTVTGVHSLSPASLDGQFDPSVQMQVIAVAPGEAVPAGAIPVGWATVGEGQQEFDSKAAEARPETSAVPVKKSAWRIVDPKTGRDV